ncbi:hypothetical protein MrNuV_ORF031 [Macrobrachium rosenbergii nudivirus]|nr:hypothetical protein MrNuV_ORF031 [Macrobrachium rosenbergii nudivirus]
MRNFNFKSAVPHVVTDVDLYSNDLLRECLSSYTTYMWKQNPEEKIPKQFKLSIDMIDTLFDLQIHEIENKDDQEDKLCHLWLLVRITLEDKEKYYLEFSAEKVGINYGLDWSAEVFITKDFSAFMAYCVEAGHFENNKEWVQQLVL